MHKIFLGPNWKVIFTAQWQEILDRLSKNREEEEENEQH